MKEMTRVAPKFDGIFDLIDFILDCVEFPSIEERFRPLPTVEGKDLRDFAGEEYVKLIKKYCFGNSIGDGMKELIIEEIKK